ncbi:MAG: transcriptional repressor LexA [Clostridia bacterium]|nr:transcriptional repressor LexA [Clostridia bacterium]
MEDLTKMQQKIYDYISDEILQNNVPPTVREIASAVGLKSTSSVQANLDSLENKGYIERNPYSKRNIRLVGLEAAEYVNVPIVGHVAAGTPITAIEQIEGYLPYSGYIPKDKNLFALRVQGESMINAGILDGDIIVAEQTPIASNGDMVVALVEDDATVKTFYKEKGHFRLQPENDDMEPIIVNEVMILGKVTAVFRYY